MRRYHLLTLVVVVLAKTVATQQPVNDGKVMCGGLLMSAADCKAMLYKPAVPVFVRLHKVGSTTISLLLECAKVQAPQLLQANLSPWMTRRCPIKFVRNNTVIWPPEVHWDFPTAKPTSEDTGKLCCEYRGLFEQVSVGYLLIQSQVTKPDPWQLAVDRPVVPPHR